MIGEHLSRPSLAFCKRFILVALLGVGALLMAGCLRYDLAISVTEDGSGEIRLVAAIAEEFAALAGDDLADIPTDGSELYPDARIEPYEQDGFIGQVVTIPFADLDGLTALLDEFFTGEQTASVVLLDDDTWEFSMVLGSAADIAGPLQPDGDGDSDGEAEELPAAMLDALGFNEAEIVIRVSLPGELGEHNADRVEDGIMIWEPVVTDSGPFTFSGRSHSGGDSSVLLGLAGVELFALVLVVIAAGAFGFLLLRERRKAAV